MLPRGGSFIVTAEPAGDDSWRPTVHTHDRENYDDFMRAKRALGDERVWKLATDSVRNDLASVAHRVVAMRVSTPIGRRARRSMRNGRTSARGRKIITREMVESMSASEINKWLDALDDEASKITDEFIAAGRGNERPSETMRMSDPLAVRYVQNLNDRTMFRDEIARRYGPGAPSRLPTGRGTIRARR